MFVGYHRPVMARPWPANPFGVAREIKSVLALRSLDFREKKFHFEQLQIEKIKSINRPWSCLSSIMLAMKTSWDSGKKLEWSAARFSSPMIATAMRMGAEHFGKVSTTSHTCRSGMISPQWIIRNTRFSCHKRQET